MNEVVKKELQDIPKYSELTDDEKSILEDIIDIIAVLENVSMKVV